MPRLFSMMLAAAGGLTDLNLVISSDALSGYDVQAEAISKGWDGVSIINVSVTINTGIQVGSTDIATPGMDFGTFPANSQLSLTINGTGTLNGASGAAGAGAALGAVGEAGGNGGVALYTRSALDLTNNNEIWGGGAGGGGGGSADVYDSVECTHAERGGGNGGAGYGNVANTSGGIPGSSGAQLTGGTDCSSSSCNYTDLKGGSGGNGGAKGANGSSGGAGSASGTCTSDHKNGGGGGTAGHAIDGTSFVTKLVTGTITGTEAN